MAETFFSFLSLGEKEEEEKESHKRERERERERESFCLGATALRREKRQRGINTRGPALSKTKAKIPTRVSVSPGLGLMFFSPFFPSPLASSPSRLCFPLRKAGVHLSSRVVGVNVAWRGRDVRFLVLLT